METFYGCLKSQAAPGTRRAISWCRWAVPPRPPSGVRLRGQAEARALFGFHLFVDASLGAIGTQNETQHEGEENADQQGRGNRPDRVDPPAVSYTQLDVCKRQVLHSQFAFSQSTSNSTRRSDQGGPP